MESVLAAAAVAVAADLVVVLGLHLHSLLPVCQEDGAALMRVISLLCLLPLSIKNFPCCYGVQVL